MATDDETDAEKLTHLQAYWLAFTAEQRLAVLEFCQCLNQTGEKTDAAILLIARRNKP